MMICSCFSWGAVLGFSTANAVVVSITAKSWDKNESIKVPWPRWFCFGGKDGFWGSKKPMFFEVKIWNHPRENNQIIWKYKCFFFDVCRFRMVSDRSIQLSKKQRRPIWRKICRFLGLQSLKARRGTSGTSRRRQYCWAGWPSFYWATTCFQIGSCGPLCSLIVQLTPLVKKGAQPSISARFGSDLNVTWRGGWILDGNPILNSSTFLLRWSLFNYL